MVPPLVPATVPTSSVPVLLELSVTASPSVRLRIVPLLVPNRPTPDVDELVIVKFVMPQAEPPASAHHWPSSLPVKVPSGVLELNAAPPPLMLVPSAEVPEREIAARSPTPLI